MTVSAGVASYVLDPLERASRTFVQQFVVILLATGSAGLLVHQNWLIAADSAAFAAVVSILTSVGTFWVTAQTPSVDLVLRVAKTFLQSFLGTLVAQNVLSVEHADWKGAVAVAIPVALTALLTGLAAMGVPGTIGASLVPAGMAVAVDGDPDYFPDVDAEADPTTE